MGILFVVLQCNFDVLCNFVNVIQMYHEYTLNVNVSYIMYHVNVLMYPESL